jgi:hypothetical protein
MKRKCFLAASILALFAVMPIEASVIAYGDPADIGNQLWNGSLGENFTVNSTIIVSALAVYDSGQDGITGLLTAAIFASDSTQETPTLTFTGTTGSLVGGDLFLTLATPVTLLPGTYSLTTAGWGPNAPNPNGNGSCTSGDCGLPPTPYTPPTLNTDGGAITFTGIGYLAGGGLQYLAPVSPFPADEFNAGSFQFDTATPEPGPVIGVTLGLMAFVILGSRLKVSGRTSLRRTFPPATE